MSAAADIFEIVFEQMAPGFAAYGADERKLPVLSNEVRHDLDSAWDTIWSTGVTNPIVVSDLIGSLLMAGASEESWELLHFTVSRGSATEIAKTFADIRRAFGVAPGSEIEAPEFWMSGHSLLRTMALIGPVIEANGDVLGDIYEHILSKLSFAGHFGQFRTPRHIVEFMVAVIDPKNAEIVMDPACGSGGFLVSASDYRKSKGRTGKEIGIEIDRTISRIAMANTVFHGLRGADIFHSDGLTHELAIPPDVVLANPPFAGSVSAEVSARFDSGSKKTEVLFVESIANSLAEGGRAAVVVPTGVVNGGNGATKSVRKLLVESNCLEAVIDLPNGVFRPYTDVKTAILIWRNIKPSPGEKTKMIRVGADGLSLDSRRAPIEENDLPAALCVLRSGDGGLPYSLVDRAEIAENGYNLSPSRYLNVRKAEEVRPPDVGEVIGRIKQSIGRMSEKMSLIEELIQ